MFIRFTESRWLNTEDRTKAPKFKEGSTHDLSVASAYRWVRRSAAVYVDAMPVKVDRPMMGSEPSSIGNYPGRKFVPVGEYSAAAAVILPKPKKTKRTKKGA